MNSAQKFQFVITLVFLTGVHAQLRAEQFTGTLQWSNKVVISTPVSGVIEKVYANAGDKVAKGEKLLELDNSVFKAENVAARANARNKNAEYLEAKRELDRMQELYDRTMLAEHDLQVTRNNLIKALAEKEKAAARYDKAKHDLKYSTLQAPYDALVLERFAQPGQVITADLKPEPLFAIAEAGRMQARVLVGEDWLARLRKGMAAKVSVGTDTYTGEVIAIGLEPATGTSGNKGYPVDIGFSNNDRLLRSGQQAKVDIE